MPLPVVLLAGAALAGATGVASGAKGAQRMVQSGNKKKEIDAQHNLNMNFYEAIFNDTTEKMDKLGEFEFMIMSEFQDFSDVIEKIENRPQFGEIVPDGFEIPDFSLEEIKKIAVGATALVSGIGGATAGTFGGFAAAGAMYAAVMALGTASTGTAIASLSGAAATNAALAALGGGAIAAGGGGMALGSTVLGVSTLGVGLMVGGIIFNIAGSSVEKKVNEAGEQIEKETAEVNKVCSYLDELGNAALNYTNALAIVKRIYDKHFARLEYTVLVEGTTDYRKFTETDKLSYQNSALLIGLLYQMLKVKVVKKVDEENNEVNSDELNIGLEKAHRMMGKDPLIKEDQVKYLEEKITTHRYETIKERLEREAEEAAQAETVEEKNAFNETMGAIGQGISNIASNAGEGLNKAAGAMKKGLGNAASFAAGGLAALANKMNADAGNTKEAKDLTNTAVGTTDYKSPECGQLSNDPEYKFPDFNPVQPVTPPDNNG